MVVVRVATARTNKFRETVLAFFTREQTGVFKLLSDIGTGNSLVYATHFKVFVACELMAGIQVAVGRYREILVTRTARGNAFGKTGSALQVYVEMEEIKALARLMAFQIFLAKIFVFFFDCGNMLVLDL